MLIFYKSVLSVVFVSYFLMNDLLASNNKTHVIPCVDSLTLSSNVTETPNLDRLRNTLDRLALTEEMDLGLHELFLELSSDLTKRGQTALERNFNRFWKDFVGYARKKGGEWIDPNPSRPDWAAPSRKALINLIRNMDIDFWKITLLPEANARQMAAILYAQLLNRLSPESNYPSLERFSFEADLIGETLKPFESVYLMDTRSPSEILVKEGFYASHSQNRRRRLTLLESVIPAEVRALEAVFDIEQISPDVPSYLLVAKDFGTDLQRHIVAKSVTPDAILSMGFDIKILPVEVYEYRMTSVIGVEANQLSKILNSNGVVVTNFIGINKIDRYRKITINWANRHHEIIRTTDWLPLFEGDAN